MKQLDFMKQTYNYLEDFPKNLSADQKIEIERLRRVSDKAKDYITEVEGRIESLREFLRLYEDGLTWEEIEKHLKNGCHCKELKGEEARKALKEGD